jgi:tetrahydromethanopterin S-methyltransferase subunit B
MSKLERKQVGTNQSAAILFNKNSELLPVTRQKLVNLQETLKRDKLTPWLWFNSRGVNVTDFYGKTISMSGGLYGQSQALVFFSFIVPFLKDAIVKTLEEILETCRTRGLTPEEPYIRETAMLLDGYLIDPIYRYMADIDRRIRGRGDPKSVGRRDVTDEITEMVKFLDKCKDEMIQGIKEAETEQNTTPAKRCGIKRITGWIFKKTSHFILIVIVTIFATVIATIVVDIFGDFGWIEWIRNILTRK